MSRTSQSPTRVKITSVSSLTSFGPVLDPIVRRCNSLFGHVTRLPEDTPSHQALWCHIQLSLGRLPNPSWRRCPGRPRNRLLDQLCSHSSTPPADLWRRAVMRGHSGVTLRRVDDYALRRRRRRRHFQSTL